MLNEGHWSMNYDKQNKTKQNNLDFYPRAQKKKFFFFRAQKFTDHKTLLSQCVGLCFKNSKSKAFVLQHENKSEMHKAKLKIFLLLLLLLSPSDPMDRSPPALSMGFFRKNTGVGCHFFLQGIFQTQGSNPRLFRSKSDTERQISYDITYMWNLKKRGYKLIYKIERVTDVKNKLMVTRG